MVVTHRWAVSLAVMLGAGAGAAAAQDSAGVRVEITLTEAITRSLDVVPAIVQARGTARNAGAGVRATTGAFFPQITTGGSAIRSGGSALEPNTNNIVTGPTRSTYSGNLSVSMNLFDGFQRLSERQAAGATQDAADAGLINQRYQVTLSTKELFYTAIANEELVRVSDAQVRRAQQQLQISIEKLRAGSATRSDSLRSTVDYGNARIALLQAQANLATAQANLGRQVGVEHRVRAIPDTGMPAFPDTTGLRVTAIENAPAAQQAEAQARAASAQVAASRSSYWPTFSTSVSGGTQGDVWPWAVTTDPWLTSWSLRLTASWTLFNGFSRERSLTQASVTRDNARATAADERRRVSAVLTQQLAALATNFEQITIARANLAAATEDLRVQQERYRVGAATILDLLTSQAALTQAEVTVVQRRLDFLLARSRVEALVGRTL